MRPVTRLPALALTVLLTSCGGGSGGGSSGPLELHDAGYFSIQKPRGWQVITAGACGTFAFLVRDPADPLRQVFYFGTIGPVYLAESQRTIDQAYMDAGGFPIPWIDAPAVDPLTPAHLLEHWPDVAAMDAATAFMPQFPPLAGLRLVSTTPRPAMLPGGETGEARGLFTLGDRVGEGLFLATVKVFSPFTGMPAGGTGYSHFVCGVTAPKAEFPEKVELLRTSLDSFTVTQSYADYCFAQSQATWAAVAEAGRTLSEASDILWEGWLARTQAEDVTAESWTDAFRGVERVYDPSTGTVYEVPAGWYDGYDPSHCATQLLLLGTSDPYDLWMKATVPASEIRC
jgi:hypothetical protein